MFNPEGICTEKFVCFISGSFELQMHENGTFFAPVKYALVYRMPWSLGLHSTLFCALLNSVAV